MAIDTDISLTDIDEVLSFLGADAKKDGIWVYWSPDDVDAATIEVTDTTLVLKVTVGTATRAATGIVATIGTDAVHGLVVGSSVVISNMGDATYDGIHTVTVVPDNTHFKFALAHAEVETVDTAGTVVGTNTLPFAVGTTHRAVASNVATITTDPANGLAVDSSIVISGMTDTTYNGAHTVTVVDDTTHFKFALVHADEVEIADTAGTVTIMISGLITAINALTGWKSGRICHGDADSTDLVVTGALDADGTENEQILKIIDHYLLIELINRASDLINRYCNRLLKTTDYTREIYYGSGFDELLLEQYPVTRIARLSVGRANSFSILNTSTDANFCTVEITATTIRLIVDGGGNDDDTELTLADYATIDLLIAAIPAKGWACTTMATDTGTRDASELLIRPSMFVDATKRAYCETVDDDLTDYKLLKPIEARNEGILYRPGVFSVGSEYFINYTAGYTDPIPYALEQACIELVAYKYGKSKRADSGDLQSETFGEGADYKYVKFNLADIKNILPPELLAQLDLFKKRSF